MLVHIHHFAHMASIFDHIALVKAKPGCGVNGGGTAHAFAIEIRVMPHTFIKAAQIRANLFAQVGHHGARVGGKSARACFNMVARQGDPGG